MNNQNLKYRWQVAVNQILVPQMMMKASRIKMVYKPNYQK
jgi:hypothetical protein